MGLMAGKRLVSAQATMSARKQLSRFAFLHETYRYYGDLNAKEYVVPSLCLACLKFCDLRSCLCLPQRVIIHHSSLYCRFRLVDNCFVINCDEVSSQYGELRLGGNENADWSVINIRALNNVPILEWRCLG